MPRLLSLLLAGFASMPALGLAHRLTDVIDADDGDDPFDAVVDVTYDRSLRRAKITREFNCNPARGREAESCPGAGAQGALLHVKELRYERIRHTITPRARFGLWHDLELSVEAPVVAEDTQAIRFAGDGGKSDGVAIDGSVSTIAPDDGVKLFDVPTEGLPTRAGFGDMLFKLRYSPIAQERDDQRGDWTLEVGYRAPTGEVMKYGNEGVGRGVHELIFGTSLSKRFAYMDPFMAVQVAVPFGADGSLFKDYGFAQEHIDPGVRASFDMGAEIVPFEDAEKGMKFFISLGLGATYQAEGRDYSELFDALAIGARRCAPANPDTEVADPNCAVYNPDSGSSVRNTPIDGVTTVEEYVTVRGNLGMGAHIGPFFRLGVDLSLAHDTEHYLSNADIGKVIPRADDDGAGRVESRDQPRYDVNEHNPTYSPAIDAVGHRIRVEETTVFGVAVNLALTF
ncbi:MAG: hypothetical protein H6702_00180 [Myxococcales bacterium]|nr:hypothetical protein [Myxococcales bacterium]